MVWVSIIHPKCSFDGKIIEGKKMLRELLAEETLGNLKKLSDMRTKQVRKMTKDDDLRKNLCGGERSKYLKTEVRYARPVKINLYYFKRSFK